MKKILLFMLAISAILSSCMKQDLNDIRSRLTNLEEWQKSVNSSITSLQSLVRALEEKDFVTSVTPLADGTGYVITFEKNGAITIKHGQEGATPIIGTKQDTDGKYYWTINGEWLLDNEAKIPTTGNDGLVPYIGENGNWWIGTTDTGVKAQGNDGIDGNDGLTPYIGENGNWWIGATDTGVKAQGDDGIDGNDGLTPYIGENGNWWIGTTDTGVKAQGNDGIDGNDGLTPYIGENGNWWIGTTDTGVKAQGDDGIDGNDGDTPYIGENGNWWIGTTDTGVKAQGDDGIDGNDGLTPYIGENGNWWIGATDTGVKAQGNDAVAPQLRINSTTGEWEVSTDGGTTWTSTGVKAQGDAIFAKDGIDNSNADYVELTLADGTTKIKLPKYQAFSIAFESDDVFYASPAGNYLTLVLPSTLKESDYRSITAVVTSAQGADVQTRSAGEDWTVTVTKPSFDADGNMVAGSAKVSVSGNKNTRLSDTHLLRVSLIANDGREVTASRLVKYFAGVIVSGFSDIKNAAAVKGLAWKGPIQDSDFSDINSFLLNLEVLDLTMAEGSQIPEKALCYSSLRKIWLSSTFQSIGEAAFLGAASLEEIDLADVKEINKAAFIRCTNLKTIDIPESVTSLGGWIFQDCANLTTVKLHEGLTSISQSTFYGCGITEIHIPNTVTKIPKRAFQKCTNMERVFLHDGITSIGEGAFSGCFSLKSFVVPKGVTELSANTFENCGDLQYVTLHDNITSLGDRVFYGCNSLRFDIVNVTIMPASLEKIGAEAFTDCYGFTHLDLSETQVTAIQHNTFNGCKNLLQIELPRGLTSIGDNAFWGAGIYSIYLPATLKTIGKSAFTLCDKLVQVFSYAEDAPAIEMTTFPTSAKTGCGLYILKGNTNYSSWSPYFKSTSAILTK